MICNNNYFADILRVCEIKDLIRVMRFKVLKDIEILEIIPVPLIMTLSRGHTEQIKRTVKGLGN